MKNITLWFDQWEFQDPKTEVLYHIRPYKTIYIYGMYLQFRFLKWRLIKCLMNNDGIYNVYDSPLMFEYMFDDVLLMDIQWDI